MKLFLIKIFTLIVCIGMGQSPQSIQQKADSSNSIQRAEAYTREAIALESEGKTGAAETLVDKAIQIYLDLNELENTGLGNAYTLKANLITYQYKEYHRAIEMLIEAVRIYETNFEAGHIELVKPYWDLGKIYNMIDQPDIGFPYLEKSLAISEANEDFVQTYRAHFYLGENLFALGRFKESKSHFVKGKRMVEQKFGVDHMANAFLSTGLAFHAKVEKKAQKARAHFFEAERVYKLNLGPVHPRIAFLYTMMGDFFGEIGQSQNALKYYQKSIETNLEPLDSGGFKVADFNMNIMSREKQADLLMNQFTVNQNNSLLKSIDDLYFDNIASLQFLIKRTNPGDDLTGLSNHYRSTYDRLIDLALVEFEKTNSPEVKEKLYVMSEEARSVLQALRANELSLAAQFGSETTKAKLADKINYTRGSLARADSGSKAATAYSQALIELNAEREAIIQGQRNENQQSEWVNSVSIESIQQKLAEDQHLVEYQKLKDGYLAFVFGKSSFELVKLQMKDSVLSAQLNAFQKALEADDPKGFGKVSHQLYKQLIQPLASHIQNSRLIIVPDDLLWNVKFDLLVSQAPEGDLKFKDFDYLIKSKSIAQAYSARLAFNTVEKQVAKNSLLAFSYDLKTNEAPQLLAMRNTELGNLPGTAMEVAKIDQMIKTDAFFGEQASEENFKRLAPDYQILHLAMHALVDSEDYENAWLRFTPGSENSDDGKLETYELQGLRLQADLVVLSACNSGQGNLHRGEGILGLGSAFFFAGVKSILLSKWEVSDAVSPELMEYFYTHLKQGLPKDRALQLAKLSFLENANNLSENPLYWGSFYMVGDATALKLQKNRMAGVNWILGLLGLTLIVTLAMRSRKNKT